MFFSVNARSRSFSFCIIYYIYAQPPPASGTRLDARTNSATAHRRESLEVTRYASPERGGLFRRHIAEGKRCLQIYSDKTSPEQGKVAKTERGAPRAAADAKSVACRSTATAVCGYGGSARGRRRLRRFRLWVWQPLAAGPVGAANRGQLHDARAEARLPTHQ